MALSRASISAFLFVPALLLFISPDAHAAPKAKIAAKALGPAEWYRITGGGVHRGFYSETTERNALDGSILIKQKIILFGNTGSTTKVEALALDDPSFTPVSFGYDFKSNSGKLTYVLSGRAKANGRFKDFEITFAKTKPERSVVKKTFPFPMNGIFRLNLSHYLAKLKPGLYTLDVIFEENNEPALDKRPARIFRLADKKAVNGVDCTKANVDMAGVVTEWWVAEDGRLCELNIEAMKYNVSLTTEGVASKKP